MTLVLGRFREPPQRRARANDLGVAVGEQQGVARDEGRLDTRLGVACAGLGIPVDGASVSRRERPRVAVEQPVGAQIGIVDLDGVPMLRSTKAGAPSPACDRDRGLEERVGVSLPGLPGPRVDERQSDGDGAVLVRLAGPAQTTQAFAERDSVIGVGSSTRRSHRLDRAERLALPSLPVRRSPRGRTSRRRR